MDYILSIPIYTYPYTIDLAYYYTKVLLGKELILLPEIRNALGKSLQKVHLSSGHPDQKDNLMSCLPDVVLLLVTRCLY